MKSALPNYVRNLNINEKCENAYFYAYDRLETKY